MLAGEIFHLSVRYVCMLVERFELRGSVLQISIIIIIISRGIDRHEDDVHTVTENGLTSQLDLFCRPSCCARVERRSCEQKFHF